MRYNSPLGRILLAADEKELTGLWFENSKCFGSNLPKEYRESMNGVLRKTKRWLDIYFAGENPDFLPSIHLIGTPFQKEVWKILLEIPYGKTTTYGEIAERLAKEKGKMIDRNHRPNQIPGPLEPDNYLVVYYP